MYSESDLETAVAAGALSPDAAAAFRNHVASARSSPAVDEEHFRLLTGFNDIFVAIAIALLLTALAWIGGSIATGLAGLAVAAASWGLAEYFTRARRMALPSIVLLLAFVGGIASTLTGIMVDLDPDLDDRADAIVAGGIGIVTAGAAWLHWKRFMVPITVAAGALALVGTAVAVLLAAVPEAREAIYLIALAAGIGVFAFAMWWDMSDRERRTRRSDVAFWLHLAAAPLIAHPVFHLLGIFESTIAPATAVIVLALYVGFGLVALAIDRRALLVSSLVYVLYALYALFEQAGAVELSAAFTGLVIGSALLMLSAFWHPARRFVVTQLPAMWRARLPLVDRVVAA